MREIRGGIRISAIFVFGVCFDLPGEEMGALKGHWTGSVINANGEEEKKRRNQAGGH